MKTIVTLFFIALFSNTFFAQNHYENGMKKALDLYKHYKWDEAANLFERISHAEEDKWIPYYYVANIYINKSWEVKEEAVLKAQLDKAQEYLNLAKTFSKENPEIMILQAYLYTVWIAYDGQRYGMKYAQKISSIYDDALAIAPANPRVVLAKAEWDMGSAKYFGQDTAPFCKDIERSLELYKSFKSNEMFYPNWGKERAQEVLKSCKE